MFVDTHLHLADAAYDADRDETVQRSIQSGVTVLVEIAESPETWDAAVRLAEKYPFIYASLGIHPHHAHEAGPERWPELSRRLWELLKHPKVVAIGEFGLDYFRMQNTKEQQDYLFRRQLDLAQELGKPIVIHCRDDAPSPPALCLQGEGGRRPGEGNHAHLDMQKTLKEYYPAAVYARSCPQPNGVLHCFSGTWEDAQTYLAHGFLLGIDGPVTYPNSRTLNENVSRLPLERIVLETDSPYLPPQAHRGQRNEPSYIPIIADAIALMKHKTIDEIGRQTTANARALYRIS